MEGPPESVHSKKVHVTGFPTYTQPTDLAQVFSNYGPVTVERINNKFAILAFATNDEAREAVQDSSKVNIYGEFLTVKPFNPKLEPTTPKRQFVRSKERGKIVEPQALDLSGEFHDQLANLLGAVRLSQDEVAALAVLYSDLERALQQPWPGCVAVPFGSITTGLGVKSSDADCFIRLPPGWRSPHGNHVNKAKRVLQQYPKIFAEILAIPRANTPIVKFFHVPTETNCDVTFKTPLGAQNSKLIAFLMQADPRLVPMAVVVKYWAKVHGFSGTGKLTNYALTMLIIFYLQQAPVSILPSVEWLQRDPATAVIVDEWNTGFMDDYDLMPQSTNTSYISELLGGFFQYYSTFNFAEMIVCPFLGIPVKKDLFKDLNLLPNEFDRYIQNVRNRVVSPMRFTTSICVQDPFELCHNVASAITSRLTVEIIAFFKFAATAYDTEKLNNCKNLLQTILLQKPKIPREKLHLEFRAVIFSHLTKEIENPDWKSVVRDITVKVFEQMCKIKLVKIEEKPNEAAKKQKDKFTGVITKAIWKRKQFSKLYSLMKFDFVQKQTRITEEILNVEKQTFNIQFRLTLTFKQETKHTAATIKLLEGDVEIFKEFGKFFMSIVQNWYTVLLKDSLRPREEQRHSETSSNVNNETKPEGDHDLRMSVSQTEERDTSDGVEAEAAESNID